MKTFLKKLTLFVLFLLVSGFLICVYLLQAPPVEQKKVPKLQIHTRTAIRSRPTVDSKPIVYTKDVYRFSLDQQYISNLNSGELKSELVFTAGLAHRTQLKADRLDAALKTATDWEKMFQDMTDNIRFRPSPEPIEVLLSGEEWRLRDTTGAAYTVARTNGNVNVYLPDLRSTFEANKIELSTDLEISVRQKNRRWHITDNAYKQTYTVVNGEGKLNIFQQSKFEILTAMFELDTAFKESLSEGHLTSKLIQEFVAQKAPLLRRARVSASEDGTGWQVSSPPLVYYIQDAGKKLKVYLDLDSKWLRIKVDESVKGWVQRDRGTIFEPPPPSLSSRQQAKVWLLEQIDTLKAKVERFGE